MYRVHQKGSGGPPGGSTSSGGPYGLYGEGNQPKWAGAPHPPRAHAPRVGGNPKGGAPLLGGQAPLPLAAPSRSHLEGSGPLSPSPINRWVRGGLHTQHPRRSPSPPQHLSSSIRAWRSPAGVLQLHHHHAVVLLLEPSSSTSPSPLLDQEGGDVTLTVRVLNAEVPSVRR